MGSNPTLSASFAHAACRRGPVNAGEMAEWLKAHAWKACVGQPTVGSNPTLSAIPSAVAEMMARRQSQTPRFGPLRRLRAIRVSAVHRSRRARCVADVSVLAGFMSERATGTAFDIRSGLKAEKEPCD